MIATATVGLAVAGLVISSISAATTAEGALRTASAATATEARLVASRASAEARVAGATATSVTQATRVALAEQQEADADDELAAAREYQALGEHGLALVAFSQAVAIAPDSTRVALDQQSARITATAVVKNAQAAATTQVQEVRAQATASALAATVTAVAPASRPRFAIVHSLRNVRFDGGTTLYVLIDSVDLSNSRFKEDVKEIIQVLVAQNGAKISVEIHDRLSSLTTSYKQYGDLSLGRPRTRQEDEDEAVHYIAAFSGDLRTGAYPNTLDFFVAAFTSHPVVGRYVEGFEFNPR